MDAVEHVLSRELEPLSDSIVESHSGVTGGVSAGGDAKGTLSSLG